MSNLFKFEIPQWLANRKFCGTEIIGELERKTKRAYLVVDQLGREYWLPKSQTSMELFEQKEGFVIRDRWVVEKRQGNTNKIMMVYDYDTEREARVAFNDMKNSSNFAGLGGKYREYFTFPRKTKALAVLQPKITQDPRYRQTEEAEAQ